MLVKLKKSQDEENERNILSEHLFSQVAFFVYATFDNVCGLLNRFGSFEVSIGVFANVSITFIFDYT